jgi:hypothetical protein
MPRIARFGPAIIVFDASKYMAPVRLRLFHVAANRFAGVAYRITPNSDGGETWTPDAFSEAHLRELAEHIPSLRIIGPGCPTMMEVNAADVARLTSMAREPRRRTSPWRPW